MYNKIIYSEAVKKIESGNDLKVIEGIKTLRDSGKPDTVRIIITILQNNNARDVQKECIKFLNDIKDQQAAQYIVEAIKNKLNRKNLRYIVSSAWQNNLDYSAYLDVFADVLINEDYIVAYEAFTVIENNIDKLEPSKAVKFEHKILNGLKLVEKEKQPMINEMLYVINDLKQS